MAWKRTTHWGDWVFARSRVVGFRRMQDLADEIGCGRTQLTKWLQMEKPPARMRKGFDAALAAALHTSRRIVFSEYDQISPEGADVAWELPVAGRPWREPGWKLMSTVDRARIILSHLREGPEVEKFIEYGVDLIEAGQHRAAGELDAQVEQIQKAWTDSAARQRATTRGERKRGKT